MSNLKAMCVAAKIENAIQAAIEAGNCTEKEFLDHLDNATKITIIPTSAEAISRYVGKFDESLRGALLSNPNIEKMSMDSWRDEVGAPAAKAFFDEMMQILKTPDAFTFEEFVTAALNA